MSIKQPLLVIAEWRLQKWANDKKKKIMSSMLFGITKINNWMSSMFYYKQHMSFFCNLVFLLLMPNPVALCQESFASQGRWKRCRREGDCSVLAQHWMFREREWTVPFSLLLSFSVSITMELRRGNHTARGSMHELRELKQKAHYLSPARSFLEPALPLQWWA